MSKNLPTEVNRDAIRPYSGGAWLALCEIAVPTQATQYLARNKEDVTYIGQKYTKHNLDVSPQIWTCDNSVPRVTLRVHQDINRTIENIVNESLGAVNGTVKLIKVGEKFLDEAIPALEANYDILVANSDFEWVTFTLGIPNPLTLPVPQNVYTCSQCPYAKPTLFKQTECGYDGDDPSCTGTYLDCLEKGNADRWGGDLGLDPNSMAL